MQIADALKTSVEPLDLDVLKLVGIEEPINDQQKEETEPKAKLAWEDKLKELEEPRGKKRKAGDSSDPRVPQPQAPGHIGFYLLITLAAFKAALRTNQETFVKGIYGVPATINALFYLWVYFQQLHPAYPPPYVHFKDPDSRPGCTFLERETLLMIGSFGTGEHPQIFLSSFYTPSPFVSPYLLHFHACRHRLPRG